MAMFDYKTFDINLIPGKMMPTKSFFFRPETRCKMHLVQFLIFEIFDFSQKFQFFSGDEADRAR